MPRCQSDSVNLMPKEGYIISALSRSVNNIAVYMHRYASLIIRLYKPAAQYLSLPRRLSCFACPRVFVYSMMSYQLQYDVLSI